MDAAQALSSTLRQARSALHARANVVATGIGYKVSDGQRTRELSIVCSVTEKVPATALSAADMVPPAIDGIPTDVVATGVIRALGVHTDRLRPAPGGVSLGHFRITAGTLGCIVRRGDELLILSNNHVIADSNEAAAGDAILQPGVIDGGNAESDKIAVLDRFIPIVMAGESSSCAFANAVARVANFLARVTRSDARLQAVTARVVHNLVDAATARPLSPDFVDPAIFGVGPVTGQARAELGMNVTKSGRTTGVTTGRIEQIDVTVDVGYGAGRVARFTDQVMAGAMSQPGDSGSAVLTTDGRLVGLLFAGSERTTIMNRIEHVFAALEIGL
jgi:hypothetical protein